MEILRGIAVSPGVAIAEVVVLEAEDFRIPYRGVAADQVSAELECLARAFVNAKGELVGQADGTF